MTIFANDLLVVDRRDSTGQVGSYGTLQLYSTTNNNVNVTQATSRTTGVTLNSPVGNITLVSAANSQVDATFTVTNSFVETNDVIIFSQKSGTDPQRIAVTKVLGGSFNVTCAAISGATTEAPVFNFLVRKGVMI